MRIRHPGVAARPRADTQASHERAVQRVIGLMHERLDEELSLRIMAEVANMSAFHFNRTFHHVTGLPPRHFLSTLRLDRARHLLLNTSARITDVCLDVGYSSLGTFTRRFTEIFGVSPRRLRSSAALPFVPPPAISDAPPHLAAGETSVRGQLTAPDGFTGLIVIGLFPLPIPCGPPVACAIVHRAGKFCLSSPSGRYYFYALGIPQPHTAQHLLILDDVLRGPGGVVELSETTESTFVDVTLRPRTPFDPPILVTLPQLIGNCQRRAPALKGVGPQ